MDADRTPGTGKELPVKLSNMRTHVLGDTHLLPPYDMKSCALVASTSKSHGIGIMVRVLNPK
jgi:hypothetical protein